jgi:class 3 adenylate cyclase/tetratricopeptide (TPR) repeat protein
MHNQLHECSYKFHRNTVSRKSGVQRGGIFSLAASTSRLRLHLKAPQKRYKNKMNFCIACSARLSQNHRFCPNCGASNQSVDTGARSLVKSVKPSKRIKALPERKEVSVLFVDLCESTSFISHTDPEEARAYLDVALSLMTDAVEAFGGTVSQLLGDGLLALFGAPIAHEDHALRACLASIAMLEQTSKKSLSDQTPKLTLRIGIHSGEVIVGLAGQQLWSLYRADGTTIHLASRLEKMAKPGSILISATTQRLIDHELDSRSIGTQVIRGLAAPMELFELVPESKRSSAAPLARRQRLAPIVGRSQLMQVLDSFAQAAKVGVTRVVGFRGEAGVGKSRLLQEWQSNAALAGFTICSTQAKGYFSANPYGLIANLARNLIGTFSDPKPAAQPSLISILDILPRCENRHAVVLNDLLGMDVLDQSWISLSPNIRRDRIVETLHWLVIESLHSGPLLLVLEDVFLADRESQRVLEILVPRLLGKKILICMSYRQDFAHRWIDETWFVEHWVAPLHEAEMLLLSQAMLGQHASMLEMINTLVERADGNPFFLEQMAITLIDEGAIVGAPGDYRATNDTVEFRVPGTIANVICARVDRLPVPTKAALEAAAVLRDPITCELIGAMNDQDVTKVEQMLGMGVAAGLLNSSVDSLDKNAKQIFSFRHALVQEVISATLTRPRRRALHSKALFALREHFGEKNSEMASTLTRHAFLGEEWDQAAIFAVKSMSRAVFRSANREALRLFEMGLDAAKRVDNQTQAWTLEISLLLEAIGALMPLGHIETIFVNLERANNIADKLGDRRFQATVALQTSIFLWMRGQYTQGLEFANQALEAGRLAERRNLQMAASQSCVMHLHGLGKYHESIAEVSRTMKLFAAELGSNRLAQGWATAPIINLQSFHASSLWRVGDYVAAQEICNEAYSMLQDFDHPYSKGLVDFVQSQLWIEQEKYDSVEVLMRTSVAECIAHDVPTILPCSVAMLGSALARSGRALEAIALLEKGIEDNIYLAGGTYGEMFMRLNLGVALRQERQLDKAIDFGQQAVELTTVGEQHGHSVEALFELALTYHCNGNKESSRNCLDRALIQAQASDMPYYKNRILSEIDHLAAEESL